MAETKGSSRRSARSNGRGSSAGGRAASATASQRSPQRLSAKDAIQRVREDLPELLGHPVEAVLAVERDEDDTWQVMVQVVELARIPNSTDVLGAYLVTLDGAGDLVGYRRQRRYNRGQTDED